MCGIAGFVDPNTPPGVREEAVLRMCSAMIHRGPDDSGMASRGPATIGMRRLSIFDPVNGHQPMVTPDGRHTLVFNGAIYNFRSLQVELESAGWRFRTRCDTEVLLAALAHWGDDALKRLRGMFAFALWDSAEESLFIARDPFGIKPLYFSCESGRLVFASEVAALLASGSNPGEIDPVSVADYLAWLAVPAPRTIYRGILSLQPGEGLRFCRGRLDIRPTWTFQSIPVDPAPCASREEFVRGLRERLEDTIRAHVLADVPVGAFLSGGLDSAAIVGLMSRASSNALKTFSIGFEEDDFSEAADAEETARHFGAVHHTRIVTGDEVARDLDKFLSACDQPTGDGVNTYYVSQTAHEGGVKVALSGLGGDELFGGYPSFRTLPFLARQLPMWRRLPSSLRSILAASLEIGGTRGRKLSDLLLNARDAHELAALQRRVFSETSRRLMLAPDVAAQIESLAPFHPRLEALRADVGEADLHSLMSAWEMRTYMADVLLRDGDVMSMRHSLEMRVPFIDRPLVEWLWRQPARFRDDQRHPKSALVEATSDILPKGLIKRRKRGFTLPFPIWMRRDLRPFLEDTFSAASIGRSGFFSAGPVQALWKEFASGGEEREWSRVWSLAVLIAFVNRRKNHAAPLCRSFPYRIETANARRSEPLPPGLPARRRVVKTLLLAPELFAGEGGITRILRLYLKALCELADNKDSVRFVSLNDSIVEFEALRRYSGSRLVEWRACSRSKLTFSNAALRMGLRSDRIVCGHIAQLPLAWAAAMLRPRLSYYLVAHGIEVWRPFTFLEQRALKGARCVWCVSEYTRRQLLERSRIPEGRTAILHNALDPYLDPSSPVPAAEGAPVILTISRISIADSYKGIQHLIAAMPLVRTEIPQARLRIVGRGDGLASLQDLSRGLSLGDAVEFAGYKSDSELRDEFARCRLFALPSQKEGFGLVYLEAMAHGRPCLGALAGGTPEVINGDTGVLVKSGDVPGIAAAIVTALRRHWRIEPLLERAKMFSYLRFKERLALLLSA